MVANRSFSYIELTACVLLCECLSSDDIDIARTLWHIFALIINLVADQCQRPTIEMPCSVSAKWHSIIYLISSLIIIIPCSRNIAMYLHVY